MSLPDAIPLNAVIDRAAITDGRVRFREILTAVNAERGHILPDHRPDEALLYDLGGEAPATGKAVNIKTRLDGVKVVCATGFMAECVSFLSTCLSDGLAHVQSLGAHVSNAPLTGRGGCAENARILRDHLQTLTGQGDGPTILVPMSKGAADTMTMLANFPETAGQIDAIVSLVGCVCGSPLEPLAPKWLKWAERTLPLPTCVRFGDDAVVDLNPTTREQFVKAFSMPAGPRVYSLGAAVDETGMSRGILPSYRALARIDARTDGQMLLCDQIMPNSAFLGALNCDHIAAAMPFNRNRSLLGRFVTSQLLNHNAFPREVMLEAVVRQVLEDLG